MDTPFKRALCQGISLGGLLIIHAVVTWNLTEREVMPTTCEVQEYLSEPEPEPEPEPIPAFHEHCEFKAPEGFNQMVWNAATTQGIDPKYLAVTIYRESDCNVEALGGSGEISLSQINPSVWVDTLIGKGIIQTEADLWDPQINLNAGAFILAHYQRRADTIWGMFYRYNGSGEKARRYADAQVGVLANIDW